MSLLHVALLIFISRILTSALPQIMSWILLASGSPIILFCTLNLSLSCPFSIALHPLSLSFSLPPSLSFSPSLSLLVTSVLLGQASPSEEETCLCFPPPPPASRTTCCGCRVSSHVSGVCTRVSASPDPHICLFSSRFLYVQGNWNNK